MARTRFLAHSRAMRAILEQVRRFATADSNVLITGETGTGKNAVARELHVRSDRARQPFVTFDCASLPGSLIDSELFGHERGAFTDAHAARAGRFELAAGGTVYLDAVTELSTDAQGKLLRIVEEKHVERLGSHVAIAITARIVASADARVEQEVREGTFRGDLYHRLRVLPIYLPPLRERREDILPLARYFVSGTAAADRRAPLDISSDAAAALAQYSWPGNARELKHVVERALRDATGPRITLADLSDEILNVQPIADGTAEAPDVRPTLEELERRYIASTLRASRGNQTEAARILGISRKALWEKRKRYGLE